MSDENDTLTQRVKELEGYLTAASQRHANIFAEYYAKAEHEPLLEEVQNLKQLLLTEQQARQELWNSIVERGKAVTPTEGGGIMKRYILIIAVSWGLILTAEPALASCSQSSYIVDGKFVLCTTCCYPGSGCQTMCN